MHEYAVVWDTVVFAYLGPN